MLFFDLESDGLLDTVTKVHCINIYDTDKKQHFRFDPVSLPIEHGVKMLRDADAICGHNIIGYDILVLEKLYPGWKTEARIFDTVVMARLIFPDIKQTDWGRYQTGRLPVKLIGKHSLEAWGYRIGVFKGEFSKTTDWKHWSPEMSDYCEQDVVVCGRLYDLCMSKKPSEDSTQIEHGTFDIITRQTNHGFLFDIEKAELFYANLLSKRATLLEDLRGLFPPMVEAVGKIFTPKQDNARLGYTKGASMTKVRFVEFNPASSRHVYTILMKQYGWKPTDFTKKSKVPHYLWYLFGYNGKGAQPKEPKVDETMLKGFEQPEVKALAEYLMVNKRIAQLAEGKQAWLKQVSYQDKRIHGAVTTNGAVTGRMTHHHPNVAQTPAVYSPYGAECRDLFIVPPGYKLVGCDASGLEARCMAHYLARYDNGEFTKVILEGKKEDKTEIHSLNVARLGFTGPKARDIAKTWFYAYIYGAGDWKLGATAAEDDAYRGTTNLKGLGKKLRARFESEFGAMGALKKGLLAVVRKRGFIYGLDGRMVPIRSEHSALNTLFQGAGAIIMKKALLILDEKLQSEYLEPGEDYEFVANIHDEWQIECLERFADSIGRAAVCAIQQAGSYFKFRCPLDGEYKTGNSWKETH